MVKSPLIERNCKVPLIKNSNENQLAFFILLRKKVQHGHAKNKIYTYMTVC